MKMKKINLICLLLVLLNMSFSPAFACVQSLRSTHGGGSGKIQFVVNAPVGTVRQVLNDDQAFIKFIPGLKKWYVIKESSSRQIAKCTMSMSALIPPLNYTVQVDKISADELRFKRLAGDLKDLQGSWKLSSGKSLNTTVVTYQYSIDTGLNHVPKLIMERELRKHLQETEIKAKGELNKFIYAKAN